MKTDSITQKRTLPMSTLRELCIKEKYYTMGTCEDYDNLLFKTHRIKNITNKDLCNIARDIAIHTIEVPRYEDITSIMFILNKYSITTYFINY